jgi:hypothetical protein
MNSYSQLELLVEYMVSERLAQAQRERLVVQVPRARPPAGVRFSALLGSVMRTSANLFRRSPRCQESGAR